MKKLRRQITVFLCMTLLLSSVLSFIPASQVRVKAADSSIVAGVYYNFNSDSGSYPFFDNISPPVYLTVEKGSNDICIRDLLMAKNFVKDDEIVYGWQMAGLTFESMDTSIATIDSKTGRINAKKCGKVQFKLTCNVDPAYAENEYVKYLDNVFYGNIMVISSKAMKICRKVDSVQSYITGCKKIVEIYDGNLTASKAYKIWSLQQKYKLSTDSMLLSYATKENGSYTCQYVAYSADAVKCYRILLENTSYLESHDPFSVDTKGHFQFSALSGKGTTVTATLTKAVTKSQIYMAKCSSCSADTTSGGTNTKSSSFKICLLDSKTNALIKGTATLTLGSKTVKIKCKKSLTKGRKYQLMNEDYRSYYNMGYISAATYFDDWTHSGKSSFTAK